MNTKFEVMQLLRKSTKIGAMCVDSGQVFITDPCYVLEGDYDDPGSAYRAACNLTVDANGNSLPGGDLGHPHPLGVVSSTKYGDGCYNVYAIGDPCRPSGLYIDLEGYMDEEDE